MKHPLPQGDLTPEQIATMRRRYYMLKSNARRRARLAGTPSEFDLTLIEWYTIWQESGHYEDIGTGRGKYVMARRDTTQDYSIHNVEIISNNDNIQKNHLGVSKNRGRVFNVGIRRSDETKLKQSQAHRGANYTPTGTPIQTPAGLFANIHEAARHYGINVTAIHYFKRKYPTAYYYVKSP